METIEIRPTSRSPYILLDPKNRILEIRGKSLIGDSIHPYKKLLDHIDLYKDSIPSSIDVIISLEYISSSSEIYIFSIIKKLSELSRISVTWIYEEGDSDMIDIANQVKNEIYPIPLSTIEKTKSYIL